MGPPAYRWPPFAPGNTLGRRFESGNDAALKHGATSPDRLRPLAERIVAELSVDAPWTARAPYVATVAAWAWAEAQACLLRVYLDEQGLVDNDGTPRPATALLDQVERRAANLRGELGLSPLALAKLLAAFGTATAAGGDDGGALDKLKAQGAKFIEATTQPATQPEPEPESTETASVGE